MKFELSSKNKFNLKQTLECGQVFRYKPINSGYIVFSDDKKAVITEEGNKYIIDTTDIFYFKKYFDLQRNYNTIHKALSKFEVMKNPLQFGKGIRILNQNLFEVFISFIISANNNIKRIQKIINNICEKFGKKIDDYYAFPTPEELTTASEQDFVNAGAGYRAKYLVKATKEFIEFNFEEFNSLPLLLQQKKILNFSGVGPKVADCILLFGFHNTFAFPVDTWIIKSFNKYFNSKQENVSVKDMRMQLSAIFGEYSGYAQQYLFYYERQK